MRVLSGTAIQHVDETFNHIADDCKISEEASGTHTSAIFIFFYNENRNNAVKSMINFRLVDLTDISMAISALVPVN